MKNYKLFAALGMLSITLKLVTLMLIYKIITVFSIKVLAATFTIPLWFLIGDVITELYGYKLSRQIIWVTIICQFIFAFTCAGFANIHSPTTAINAATYSQVYSTLPRLAITSLLSVVTGGIINAYILNKWKIMFRGEYFLLRSLGSTAIGELFFTVVAYLLEFLGVLPIEIIMQLMLVSYLTKLVLSLVMGVPVSIIVDIIKHYNNKFDTFTAPSNSENDVTVVMVYSKPNGIVCFEDRPMKNVFATFVGGCSNKIDAVNFVVRQTHAGVEYVWKPVSKAQYIMYLSGKVEIQAESDSRTLKAGDILFVSNNLAQGFLTKVLSDEKSIVITT